VDARHKAGHDGARGSDRPDDALAFLARLTDAEYAAIIALAQAQLTADPPDAAIQRWTDAMRLTGAVRPEDPEAQAAKAVLVAAGALSQARADQIFTLA